MIMQLVVLKIGLAGAQLAFQRVDWFGWSTACFSESWLVWLEHSLLFRELIGLARKQCVGLFFCGCMCGRSLRNQCVGLFLWQYVWFLQQVFEKPVCWFIFMAVCLVSSAGLWETSVLVYFYGCVSGFFGRSLRNQCVGLFLWLCVWFLRQVFEKPVCWFIFMAVCLVSSAGLWETSVLFYFYGCVSVLFVAGLWETSVLVVYVYGCVCGFCGRSSSHPIYSVPMLWWRWQPDLQKIR